MTNRRHAPDLTPEERARWEALPVERTVPPALEERVVRALRRQRLVRPVVPGRWPRLAVGIAAAVAIFALGMIAGTRLVVRPADTSAGVTGEPALQLQQAGSAYIQALARLEPWAGDPADSVIVSQVALRTFEGAAREISRLSSTRPAPAPSSDRNVVWF